MAIELISTVKPKNSGTFPIVEANDIKGGYYSVESIEIRDSIPEGRRMPGMLCYVYGDKIYKLEDDLTTWVEFTVSGGGGGGSSDPTPNGIWIGVSPPPDDNIDYVLWIDTSDQSLDESFSSLVIDEFKSILTSLTNRVIELEEDVAYLKEYGGGGGTVNPPTDTSSAILMTFEDGSVMTFEDGSLMAFSTNGSYTPIPTTNDILMTFEGGELMTFEGGEVMCFSIDTTVVTTNDIILTDENGNILTFEDGSIMTFESI